MNDDQVDKIIKELRDIRGIMSKAYQLFWVASLLLLLILVVNFIQIYYIGSVIQSYDQKNRSHWKPCAASSGRNR